MSFRNLARMTRTSVRPTIRGVIFDMGSRFEVDCRLTVDGTLCLPQNWMFGQMRDALGIDKKTDILEYIESLPNLQARKEAHAKIEKVEEDAMNKMVCGCFIMLRIRLLKKGWWG